MNAVISIVGIFFSWSVVIGMSHITFVPVATLYTPNSILEHKELYKPVQVCDRMRYATCTSVDWISNNKLAVLNLYGQHLRVYSFERDTKQLCQLQYISNQDGACLGEPEHCSFCHNCSMALIANSNPGSINLYMISPDDTICPQPIASVRHRNLVHNVRFTPNGRYCACVVFDKVDAFYIYRIEIKSGKVSLQQVYHATHTFRLRAKAINFTSDGRFMIVAYAYCATHSINVPPESVLEVYRFEQETGTVGDRVCTVSGSLAIEDMVITRNQKHIIITDQAGDALVVYSFDTDRGLIDQHSQIFSGAEFGLHFPHGLSLSPDEKYLALSNYGDDSVRIYELQEHSDIEPQS